MSQEIKVVNELGTASSMNNLCTLHKLADIHFKGTRGLNYEEETELLKRMEGGAESRRKAGRYTLEEAAFYIGTPNPASIKRIFYALSVAQGNGSLKAYRSGDKISYDIKSENISFPWSDEVYWDDLNTWLEENQPRIGPMFPPPDTSVTDAIDQNALKPLNERLSLKTDNESPAKIPPWWQTDYDIHLQAKVAGDSLRYKGEKPSNTKIAKKISSYIQDKEVMNGKKRKAPAPMTIKNTVLKGWRYTAE